jgi:hypothetical protein
MPDDPIVGEVRRIRDELAAKFGYNLRAIAEDARRRELESGRQLVSFARPKKGPEARLADSAEARE